MTRPLVISYIRFSTAKQAGGTSLARQTLLARNWCARRGWTLNESLTLHDLGISGFDQDEGTASARISRYETGVHEPPFSIAVKLAKALRVPAAYFYCEDDELANVVLAWGRLSKSERKRIKPLILAKLAAKSAG